MTGITGNDQFSKLKDEDKKEIFDHLISHKTELSCKIVDIKEGAMLTLKVLAELNGKLECRMLKSEGTVTNSGMMIVQMQVGSEKYMASMTFKYLAGSMFLSMDVDIFHLQRREHFRLRLPSNYKATMNLRQIPGMFHVIDLSGGGCRISGALFPRTLNIGDMLDGVMTIPGHEEWIVKIQVRHVKKEEKTEVVGCQFMGQSEKDANRLAALVMDLYRELFSRYT